jgi:hypothetical protein
MSAASPSPSPNAGVRSVHVNGPIGATGKPKSSSGSKPKAKAAEPAISVPRQQPAQHKRKMLRTVTPAAAHQPVRKGGR